ncbi:MAG: BatD family protein, partial [Deltaproteobacteria bacterium]|nr:BatD family protein [Deltaproteobacteria bacterium]
GEADRGTFDTPIYALTTGIESAVESSPLELEVIPLPEDQRPDDFSGLVGSFQIDSLLEPATIKAGESAILTVFLSGMGNVDRIPDLKLPELDQIKAYPDQAALKIEPDAKGLTASKTMRWALVPEKGGDYEIPPLSISFFDTKTQKYRVLKTSLHSLSVLAGERVQGLADGKEEGTNNAAHKHAVREIGRDILPVRGSVQDLATGFRVRFDGLAFWVILLAPLFVYVGTFWRLKSQNRTDSAIAAIKAKRAGKKLIRQYRQAGFSSNDLTLSIRNYLNERFGLSVGTLTSDEAAVILESHGVNIETAKKMRKLIGKLEDAVYTGKGDEASEMGKQIPKLVKQIEREIR